MFHILITSSADISGLGRINTSMLTDQQLMNFFSLPRVTKILAEPFEGTNMMLVHGRESRVVRLQVTSAISIGTART